MKITLEIPNDKVALARGALLFIHPVPESKEGKPEMSENQWLGHEWLRRYVRREIARGLQAKKASEGKFVEDASSVL